MPQAKMNAPEARTLSLSAIHRDQRFQVRVALDQGSVERYKTALMAGKSEPADFDVRAP